MIQGSREQGLLQKLGQLESLRDPSRGGKREFRRFPVRCEADLQPEGAGATDERPMRVWVRDISLGGLGFISEDYVEPGSIWRIMLRQHGYHVGEQCLIARYCREIETGVFLTGCEVSADFGLMAMLGVNPAEIAGSDLRNHGEDLGDFIAPAEVA